MAWYGWILIGFALGLITGYLLLKNNLSKTEISTRKIIQKRNTDSSQDVSSTITRKGKREQRKENKRLKMANNN